MGHLEYILKYPNFSKYRQEERYPQVYVFVVASVLRAEINCWKWKFPGSPYQVHFRNYIQVICLTDEEAVDLVQEVLRQILNLHKNFAMKYFHIGADEVFQVFFMDRLRLFIADFLWIM